MIGILLGSACAAVEVFMMVRIYQSCTWHHRGLGERTARAEYARIRLEQPKVAEARLTESEFVRDYVAGRPHLGRYVCGALALLLIGIFGAPAIGTME